MPAKAEPRRVAATLQLPIPRPRLWEIFADQARFSRRMGEAPWAESRCDPEADVPTLRGRVATRSGAPVSVTLEANQWVRGHSFSSARNVEGLPLSRAALSFALRSDPEPATGTTVEITLDYFPSSADELAAATALAEDVLQRAAAAVESLAAALLIGAEDPYAGAPPADAASVQSRAAQLLDAETMSEEEREAAERLARYLSTADELQLGCMRPLALARAWGLPAEPVVRTCLRAARAGALELFWEILCPYCRHSGMRNRKLSDVGAHASCATCVGSFDLEFDRLVEATFRPAPSLRSANEVPFTQTDPSRAPQVEAQLIVEKSTPRTVELNLEPGEYQIWAQRGHESVPLFVTEDGPEATTVVLQSGAASSELVKLRSGGARLTLHVGCEQRRLIIIRSPGWIADVASAAHVTALQEFRDLYPREAVAAGERIRVGHLAFLFSDLKGSTAMFERLGDGPAYSHVRDHFALLTECVREQGGAVVKTIGDAIMAVFPKTTAAVAAALAIQRRLPAFNQRSAAREACIVKLGVHAGPCVVTSANDWLDYFGTTVNLAARVQGQSQGGDLVLLSRLLDDPEVAKLTEGVARTVYEARLAGLHSLYTLCRLTVDEAAA